MQLKLNVKCAPEPTMDLTSTELDFYNYNCNKFHGKYRGSFTNSKAAWT